MNKKSFGEIITELDTYYSDLFGINQDAILSFRHDFCNDKDAIKKYLDLLKNSKLKDTNEIQKIQMISNQIIKNIPQGYAAVTMDVFFKQVMGINPNNANKMVIAIRSDFQKEKDVCSFLKNSKGNIFCSIAFMFWLFYGLVNSKVGYVIKKDNKEEILYERLYNILGCAVILNLKVDDVSDIISVVMQWCGHPVIDYKLKSESEDVRNCINLFRDNLKKQDADSSDDYNQHIEYVKTFEHYLSDITGYSAVLVNTIEEAEAENVIIEAAKNVFESNVEIIKWDNLSKENCESFSGYLQIIYDNYKQWEDNRIYIFRTVDAELKQPEVAGKLQILIENISKNNTQSDSGKIFIFIISRHLELDSYIYKDETIGYPDDSSIRKICSTIMGTSDVSEKIISSCRGLTREDIKRVITPLDKDLELSKKVQYIINEKKRIIKNSSLLEIVDCDEVERPCGLSKLIIELEKVKKIIDNENEARANKVDMPKGLLLTGVPGCGKSMSAKWAAKLFQIPLLKLEMGLIMSKYQGESDHNFKDALKLAEAIAPCVLWLDEIEKVFDSTTDKSESSSRILGSFLTWLQEKKSTTYIISTCNDISKLPPELTRVGRWDQMFFVDLPDKKDIKEILKQHIDRNELKFFEVDKVVKDLYGYSGAEIEEVVKKANESVYTNETPLLDSKDFKKIIKQVTPLSVLRKDEVKNIRDLCHKNKFQKAN